MPDAFPAARPMKPPMISRKECEPVSATVPSALHSALLTGLGVPHAFSTRRGGYSSGIFASLNFGNPGELPADRRDPAANIHKNWRRSFFELSK